MPKHCEYNHNINDINFFLFIKILIFFSEHIDIILIRKSYSNINIENLIFIKKFV